MSDTPNLSETTHTLNIWDGTELFYRAWNLPSHDANQPAPRHALLLFHRGHEHSARLAHVAQALQKPDTAIFAWDARGHGNSPGRRGFAPSFSAMVRDMDSFIRAVTKTHNIALSNTILIANSVAAVVASAWVHDYAPPIRAMVLVTPAFEVKLYVPLAIPGLRALNTVKRDAVISSYVKPAMLTHDSDMAASYAADPLISRDISNNILIGMYDTAQRVVSDAGAIHTPALILTAGSDWVVKHAPQKRFFKNLGSSDKTLLHYPGFHHALLHEKDRAKPLADIKAFIDRQFSAQPADHAPLAVQGDPSTRARHHQLSQPLAFYNPRAWNFLGTKIFLQTLGKLSKGVRIGWQHGFDSGQSLDHVYRNTPSGITPLGWIIDKVYLSGVGWAGIRTRKQNMEATLHQCFLSLQAAGKPIHIVDIAAGPGRYLLDAIHAHPNLKITALLRDRDPVGLEEGRAIAAHMNIQSVTYQPGDAFDRAQLASLSPKPTIAIVSGLYELFPDNAMIARSLAGLHDALEPGGFLIYTNQPWHPQQELIARSLLNRDQVPWIMRCRTQLEIDTLIQSAGFQKQSLLLDDHGIFTVNLAQKLNSPPTGATA